MSVEAENIRDVFLRTRYVAIRPKRAGAACPYLVYRKELQRVDRQIERAVCSKSEQRGIRKPLLPPETESVTFRL
jgi:hypothetical protein